MPRFIIHLMASLAFVFSSSAMLFTSTALAYNSADPLVPHINMGYRLSGGSIEDIARDDGVTARAYLKVPFGAPSRPGRNSVSYGLALSAPLPDGMRYAKFGSLRGSADVLDLNFNSDGFSHLSMSGLKAVHVRPVLAADGSGRVERETRTNWWYFVIGGLALAGVIWAIADDGSDDDDLPPDPCTDDPDLPECQPAPDPDSCEVNPDQDKCMEIDPCIENPDMDGCPPLEEEEDEDLDDGRDPGAMPGPLPDPDPMDCNINPDQDGCPPIDDPVMDDDMGRGGGDVDCELPENQNQDACLPLVGAMGLGFASSLSSASVLAPVLSRPPGHSLAGAQPQTEAPAGHSAHRQTAGPAAQLVPISQTGVQAFGAVELLDL